MQGKILFLDYFDKDFDIVMSKYIGVNRDEALFNYLRKNLEGIDYDKKVKICGIFLSHVLTALANNIGQKVMEEMRNRKKKEFDSYDKVSLIGNEIMFVVVVKSIGYLWKEIVEGDLEGSYVFMDGSKFELDNEKDWDVMGILDKFYNYWSDEKIDISKELIRTLVDLVKEVVKVEDALDFLYFVQDLVFTGLSQMGSSVETLYSLFSRFIRNLDSFKGFVYKVGEKN